MDGREHQFRHVLDAVVEAPRRHQLLLASQQPVELVDHAPGDDRAPFEPGALDGQPLPQKRVIAAQHLGDLVERQLEGAETANRNRVARLLERVPPVAGEVVDVRGPEQAQLVIVAQRLRRQPRELRESPDRKELVVRDRHRGKHEASPRGRSRGQARGAYSTLPNGQSESSHSLTARQSGVSRCARLSRTQESAQAS